MTDAKSTQALVIGGSLAGLLAARVLSNHFEQVTIVDRDTFPQGPLPRRGLPQARHVHVLLARGQMALESLFPGFQAELERAGAPSMDWIGDGCWYSFGGWAPRFTSGYRVHPCSRDLLEWIIRQRLASLSNVRFLQGQEAVELLTSPDERRATGVRLQAHGQPGQEKTDLSTGLVVDATGRESPLLRWLGQHGYALPTETVINSFLGYASRLYQRPAGHTGWENLLVRGTPPANKRGGVISPIENDRWLVTLAGAGRDYPPTDEAGFMEFARSLPVPDVYQALQNAQPLSGISGYRKTENRWRHYEKLSRWPENLLAVGDAVCAFNPVYGQGMSVAALEALVLEKALSKEPSAAGRPGFARGFQQSLPRAITAAWLLATGDDYRYPETEGGKRDALTLFMHRYTDRVIAASGNDTRMFMTFFEVTQLVRPLSAFFSPRVLMKALRGYHT